MFFSEIFIEHVSQFYFEPPKVCDEEALICFLH